MRSKVETVLLYTGIKPGPDYVPWSIKTLRQRVRLVVTCAVIIVVTMVITHR
jgi:hypothetical protein